MNKRSGSGRPPFPHGSPEQGQTTGRYVVVFRKDDVKGGVNSLRTHTGARLQSMKEIESTSLVETMDVLFDTVGAAVVSLKPDEIDKLKTMMRSESPIVAIEPERYVRSLQGPHWAHAPTRQSPLGNDSMQSSRDYMRGIRDGTVFASNQFLGLSDGELSSQEVKNEPLTWDESQFTWGLQATCVDRSSRTGRDVRIAILDTGLFSKHQDFEGRRITRKSFIDNEDEDKHGHGTHCCGTAAGPKEPRSRPRYGIAPEAELLIGKVLSNAGQGADGSVIAGMEWALNNDAHIISMSLGSSVMPGELYNPVYEAIAFRALESGCLIIAAAGNEFGQPVGSPANCPSIFAVGALDEQLQPAGFSSFGRMPNGGEVNIAAPGVNVLSSWSRPGLYRRLDGTSMATPHVAGIAALWLEETKGRGWKLWRQLEEAARRLPHPLEAVGMGLVQAPFVKEP